MNLQNLPEYQAQQLSAIQNTQDLRELDAVRVELLGQKGSITAFLKGLGALAPDARKVAGAQINVVKASLQAAIEARKQHFEALLVAAQLESERIDVSLPGRGTGRGALHPLTLTLQRMQNIFQNMGFEIAQGPEIEDDWHNFTALNVPDEHPARAMHDTFYLANQPDRLLRTHASSVQIRFMQHNKPPIRMIAPGRVYRCDSDRTHSPMFHQLEGLYVAERSSVSFADLKADLQDFMSAFFGREMVLQFRPSYFPFTEPSAEVDMAWEQPDGSTKWLEILGCGMVHPNVLTGVGIDPEKYSGYAFGLGVDRFAMLYYGIDDLRVLYENDLRLLSQFA